MRKNNRGAGTFIIVLFMVFLAWLGVKSSIIYFKKSEIESTVSGLVLQSRESYNEKTLLDKIVETLKSQFQIIVDPAKIGIYQKSDMSRIFIQISYEEPLRIPYLNWGWDKPMTAIVNEKLTPSRY